MVKKFKNIPILCLFISNAVLAVKHGFNPLSVIALALAFIVIVWDLIDAYLAGKDYPNDRK